MDPTDKPIAVKMKSRFYERVAKKKDVNHLNKEKRIGKIKLVTQVYIL